MRRKRSPTHPGANKPRPGRRVPDDSPGRSPGKLPDLAGCPSCGASYREGRWTWETAPLGSYEQVCPACERIAGNYPAGVLHIEGAFARQHKDDVLGLIRNVEERDRSEHPLKRVMAIEEDASGFAITTTDAKLAEGLGRALQKAYDGDLKLPPTTADKQNLVRVRWTRD